MSMRLEKAKELIQIYQKNSYKAGQTLRDLGYSESTSLKKSGKIIDRALEVLARGDSCIIKPDEVAREYRHLIMQDRDMSTKLKALMPLLAKEGIRWNNDDKSSITPVLNLVVKKN